MQYRIQTEIGDDGVPTIEVSVSTDAGLSCGVTRVPLPEGEQFVDMEHSIKRAAVETYEAWVCKENEDKKKELALSSLREKLARLESQLPRNVKMSDDEIAAWKKGAAGFVEIPNEPVDSAPPAADVPATPVEDAPLVTPPVSEESPNE